MLFPLNRPELNYTGIQIFDFLPSSIEAALHLQLLNLNFLLNLVFCWGGKVFSEGRANTSLAVVTLNWGEVSANV